MSKTPDEIKRGLGACGATEMGRHSECTYSNEPKCMQTLLQDALAYIRQLEAERDAAVNDASLFPDCGTCKYNPYKKGYIPNDCDDCVDHCNWQWRGVQQEE